MATNLLAKIRSELEERMAELRPFLSEYERLIAAADTLASIEAEDASTASHFTAHTPTAPRTTSASPRTASASPRTASASPRRRARGPRGSAAGAIERAASTPAAGDAIEPAAATETHERAASEPYGDEHERKRKRASPDAVQQAILAALEHGSHTVSELVMVTAMSAADLRSNVGRLARREKVTKIKRDGDGKTAYALRPALA